MEEREKKMVEKKTKRALSSAMIREMREQYTDAPIEIVVSCYCHSIQVFYFRNYLWYRNNYIVKLYRLCITYLYLDLVSKFINSTKVGKIN